MKIWLYFSAMIVILTVGVFCILRFGYEPVPEVILKPSTFNRPEDLGAAVLRQFYAPVVEKKRMQIGIPPQPEWYQGVVRGFLSAAAAEKAPFDVLLVEQQLSAFNLTGVPPLDLQTIDTNSSSQAEMVDRLQQLSAAGKRVLLLTSSVYSTHLLPGNPTDRYEKITGEHVFSITLGPFPLNPNKEYLVDPPCVGTERDSNGTSDLGCSYLKASRGYYHRQLKNDHYVAIMNSPKPEDFLLLVSAPGQ